MKKNYVFLTTLVILLILSIYSSNRSLGENDQIEDTIYILTCKTYDIEQHIPIDVTNFFEVSSPSAILWFNTSNVQEKNVSIQWHQPNGAVYYVENLNMDNESAQEHIGASTLHINGKDASTYTGKWTVKVYFNEIFQASHIFTIYDRNSEEWNYFAEIIDVKSPNQPINPNEEFIVEVTISYQFGTNTVLTPGLWDPENMELYTEGFDEVEGSGTSTYKLRIQAPSEVGTYTIDVTAYYLVEDDWFLDNAGYKNFKIIVANVADPEGIKWDQIIPIFVCFIIAAGLVYFSSKKKIE